MVNTAADTHIQGQLFKEFQRFMAQTSGSEEEGARKNYKLDSGRSKKATATTKNKVISAVSLTHCWKKLPCPLRYLL
jgi:hypothetical protein